MLNSLQQRLEDIEEGNVSVCKEKSITGEVVTSYFSSPEFSAGMLRTSSYKIIKFSGKFMVNEGDRVTLHGGWIDHPKYGRQFEARSFEHDLKMTADGLAHYLSTNPAFVGIGPKKARKIADTFAEDFDRVISETPIKIKQVGKLSDCQLDTLQAEWENRKTLNSISSWLGKFGLTHNQVEKLTRKYGDGIKSILDENPYILYREVDGYGFYRADQIALKTGTPKNHPGRIQAAILYTVDQRTQAGDCWTEERELTDLVDKALALDDFSGRKLISDLLEDLLKEESPRLTAYHTSGRFLIADTVIYQREMELFEKFKKSANKKCSISSREKIELAIAECLNPSQKSAVNIAFASSILVISGAAGSGKSFTISAITQFCEEVGLSVDLCAPTGKAAKRMEELSGKPAYTIHRLLNYHPQFGWQTNKDNPLDADVVITDEFSMVDVNLAWRLFDAIDLEKTRVVLVGDHNQLPPVGPGNLLRDLLDRRIVPVVILDRVIRQAGALKENSTAILSGQVRPTSPGTNGVLRPWYVRGKYDRESDVLAELKNLIRNKLEPLGIDPVKDLQVLTPWKKGLLGVHNLNIELQRLIQRHHFGAEVEPILKNRHLPSINILTVSAM